jgi:hypothetical protein
MTNQQVSAQELLFGPDGLSATNFKMFPGVSREIDMSLAQDEIRKSLESLISSGAIEECEIAD